MFKTVRDMLGKIAPANPLYATIVWKAAEMQSTIPLTGNYFEFGVFEGKSFIQAYRAYQNFFSREAFNKMKFYAFDSFAGIPVPRGVDTAVRSFSGGECFCTREKFEHNLVKSGVDLTKVVIVEGWFENTLNIALAGAIQQGSAVFVHVDCDLYQSTSVVLDFITQYLTNGTIVSFDDWYLFGGHPELGQHRAFAEWRNSNDGWYVEEFQKEATTKNSFVLNRKGLVK